MIWSMFIYQPDLHPRSFCSFKGESVWDDRSGVVGKLWNNSSSHWLMRPSLVSSGTVAFVLNQSVTSSRWFSGFLFIQLMTNQFEMNVQYKETRERKRVFFYIIARSCLGIQLPHLHAPLAHVQFSHLHPSLPHPLPKTVKPRNTDHPLSSTNWLGVWHWQLESQVHLPVFVQSSLHAHFPAREKNIGISECSS